MKKQIVCLSAMLGLLVGCATNEENGIGTEFSELPSAVQSTVKAKAPNAKIDDIDMENRSGRTVYEITFAEPGMNPKLHVAADGTIVKTETLVTETAGAVTSMGTEFNELPSAVQKTIKQRAPNAKIADIDEENRSGRTIYEISFEESGKNPKLHIAADGTIVK